MSYKGPYEVRPWHTMDRTKDGCLCVIKRRFGYWLTNLRRFTEAEQKLQAAVEVYGSNSVAANKAREAVENRKKWLEFSEQTLRNSIRFAIARITPDSDDYKVLYNQCPNCRQDVADLGEEPFASCKLASGKSVLCCRRCYADQDYIKVTFKRDRGKFGRSNKKLHKQLIYFRNVLDTFFIVKKAVAKNSMSNEAMSKMLEMTKSSIKHFANKSARERDDAEAEAMLGLLVAAQKFDPTAANCAKFTTYASFWIRRHAQARRASHCRAGITMEKGKLTTVHSMDAVTDDGDGRSDQFHPTAATADQDLQFDVARALESLPELMAKIVVEHLMHGKPLTAVAREHNMSAYEARKLLAEGKSRLAAVLQ